MSLDVISKTLPRARLLAVVTIALAGVSLFVLGAQPFAVGLFLPPWDKLAHIATFTVIGAAAGVASNARGRLMLACCVAGALALGVMDELHQAYLPGRSASWADLAADAVGGLAGAATLRFFQLLTDRRVRSR